MWRWKAIVVGILGLVGGCATIQDQRSNRIAAVDEPQAPDMELEGCLRTGAAPGTFVLTDVAAAPPGGSSARAVDVMSTRVGLTHHVGRRIAVRGQEQVTPPRSIHDGARVFRIESVKVVEAACRKSG